MNRIGERISPLLLILIVSILGFVTGIFMVALWQENWLVTNGILNQDFMHKIDELMIDKRALFFLCIEKRLGAFFLLFLLAFSSVNVFVNVLFFVFHGLYIGSMVELLVIRYGLQGSLMYASLVLPQGIFYVIGYLLLGYWCLSAERMTSGVNRKKEEKLKGIMKKGCLLKAFVFVFIGIILESYVNLKIFKIFF